MGATRPAMGLGHVPWRGRTPTKAIAVFYKKDLNFVVLIMVFMKKGPDKFKLLFKEYQRFKPLF
jgi:hypothetical protein